MHDLDQQHAAEGGKLVRFDPRTQTYHLIGVPMPHLYIQSIAADWARGLIYGFTYPAEAVFRTDLATGASTLLAYLTNATMFVQPHNAIVDKDGWLWGTCAETRAWDETVGRIPVRLFKYHPEGDRFVWFEHGLSRREEKTQLLADPPQPPGASSAMGETRHKEDFGFCDSMAYDGDRYIYAGTTAGVLCRIDTQSGDVEKLATVTATGRLPALIVKNARPLRRRGHERMYPAHSLGHAQQPHGRLYGFTRFRDWRVPRTHSRYRRGRRSAHLSRPRTTITSDQVFSGRCDWTDAGSGKLFSNEAV